MFSNSNFEFEPIQNDPGFIDATLSTDAQFFPEPLNFTEHSYQQRLTQECDREVATIISQVITPVEVEQIQEELLEWLNGIANKCHSSPVLIQQPLKEPTPPVSPTTFINQVELDPLSPAPMPPMPEYTPPIIPHESLSIQADPRLMPPGMRSSMTTQDSQLPMSQDLTTSFVNGAQLQVVQPLEPQDFNNNETVPSSSINKENAPRVILRRNRRPSQVILPRPTAAPVEEILGELCYKGELFYYVKWQGKPECFNEWVPAAQVKNTTALLMRYRTQYRNFRM